MCATTSSKGAARQAVESCAIVLSLDANAMTATLVKPPAYVAAAALDTNGRTPATSRTIRV
jgi:hypothetical protein